MPNTKMHPKCIPRRERVKGFFGWLTSQQKTVFSKGRMYDFLFFGVSTIMLFLVGRTIFLVWGVLLTKVKIVHMTLCTIVLTMRKYYQKHPQHYVYWGERLSSSVQMYDFLC